MEVAVSRLMNLKKIRKGYKKWSSSVSMAVTIFPIYIMIFVVRFQNLHNTYVNDLMCCRANKFFFGLTQILHHLYK